MNISVKKFSKKSLSLLIALIMVFSALPLTPPISADAAEVKTNIDVWDASRAGTNSNTGQYRYSYADSKTHKTLSGIQWHGLTKNSTYLYVNDTALSIAEISSDGAITENDNDGITDKGIRGNKWSFSAKFAYTGSSTKTTVFGLSSTTKRKYTHSNDGGGTGLDNGYVADLVDIRADGTVYINNTWTSVSGITFNDLVAKSATDPKTLTVTYDNGNLTIDINGTQKISQTVNAALFSDGVGNYLAGPNVQVFAGGNAPYYEVTNDSAYLRNFNLYSLSGATYTTKTSHDNPNQTINVAGFGVMKHSSSNADRRKDNNTAINIVNDRYHSNFDIGFINFDIRSLENSGYVSVKDAICQFKARYADNGDNQGLKLYYPTKNVTEFTTSEATTGNVRAVQITTSNSNIFGGSQGANSTHLTDTINYYGLQAITDGEFTGLGSSYSDNKSLNISEAINYALRNNLDYATVIILLKQAGGATNDGSRNWTDTYFQFTSTTLTATAVDDHIWGDYHPDTANAGKHIRECEVCQKTETQNCSGGTATCTQRAICEVCRREYGSRAQHSFESNSLDFDRLRVDAGAVNNGYYYAGCKSCGVEDTRTARVYDKTDWSTYDSQKRILDELFKDSSKFTDASFAEFQNDYNSATSGVTSGDERKSQTFIDNKVKALIAAKDLLKSTVTLNIYDFQAVILNYLEILLLKMLNI